MRNKLLTLALITGLSILLRVGIVELQEYYRIRTEFLDYGLIVIFSLPLLELITLAISIVPWQLTVRIRQFLLPALMINSAWRILDYILSYNDCRVTSGGTWEGYCDTVGLQVFVHVPFLILGTIILLYHFSKRPKKIDH